MLEPRKCGGYAVERVRGEEQRKQALDLAARMSDDELSELIDALIAVHKGRVKLASYKAAQQFRTGDVVEHTRDSRKLPLGARGHVAGMKAERVLVHFDEFGAWLMDAQNLRKVDPPPAGR